MAIGMDQFNIVRRTGLAVYTPNDFGECIACLGWLYEAARNEGAADTFVKQLRVAKDNAGPNLRPLWDWYYFNLLRNEAKQTLPTAMILARGPDPAGMLAYVMRIELRTSGNMQVRRVRLRQRQ